MALPDSPPVSDRPLAASAPPVRSELDLTFRQLAGIDEWHAARRSVVADAATASASREVRMDVARRMDVIRAQHLAMIERTDAHLRSSVQLLHRSAPRRAIVVHRNAWFSEKVCADLTDQSVLVVASLTNGAEAVGAVVAEQPDLLLVEDSLPMLSGEEVVREVRRFSPTTLIAAQVAYDDRIAGMLDAGAHTAYTRRVSPGDVARGLAALVGSSR